MVRDVLAGGGAASGEEIPGQARDDGYRARDDGKGKPANDEKGRPANDGRRMEIPGQARNDDYKAGHDELGAGRDGNGDGVISYLDDGVQDAAVGYEGARRPVRCMFVRDQKLTSGQRVMVRLLEDAVVDGVRIPANTHLAAVCKIGERLELSVRSLEMGGRIVPLGLEAYDADGVRGIYCPETASSRGARRASEEAMQLGTRTFGGLVGDVAAGLLRTGASLVRSVSGEVSVRVVSGYEFYLVEK